MQGIPENFPTKQQFSEQVDSIFRARDSNGLEFDMTLVEFEELVANEVQENFTLLFLAEGDASPAQSRFRLRHESLGSMELFLVPVKRDEKGLYYEAVFNNLISTAKP